MHHRSRHESFPPLGALLTLALIFASLIATHTARADDMQLGGMTIKNWGYQLQNDTADTIANSPYDVIVIDYSKDGSTSGAFTPDELVQMKKKPDGSRRIVLSYISIGEAENYRYYWLERGWNRRANRAGVVDDQNSEWKGNYSARYWMSEWQDLILNDSDSYMNRILQAGFDGIYLDKIDVCDAYKDKTLEGAPDGAIASDLMIQFVRKISTVMKQRNPNFLIIAQNAEFLLADEDYRAALDGIGKEDILYGEQQVSNSSVYKDGVANNDTDITTTTDLVNKLKAGGGAVMGVEYLCNSKTGDCDSDAIISTAAKYQALGYLLYIGPRDLARLAPPEDVVAANGSDDPNQ